MTDQLKQLSEAATQGVWCVLDTKHLSTRAGRIFDDRMGKPANAKFVRELVNAYRAGELVPASELAEARAREAVAYEVAADAVLHKPDEMLATNRAWVDDRPYVCEENAYHRIKGLTPDHATAALEQIKQQARDDEREAAEQWRKLALQFDCHRISAMQTIKMLVASKDDAVQHVAALRDAAEFIATPPKAGRDILEEARGEGFERGMKRAEEVAGALLPENGVGQPCNAEGRLIDSVRRECVESIRAALSADTQENSDE